MSETNILEEMQTGSVTAGSLTLPRGDREQKPAHVARLHRNGNAERISQRSRQSEEELVTFQHAKMGVGISCRVPAANSLHPHKISIGAIRFWNEGGFQRSAASRPRQPFFLSFHKIGSEPLSPARPKYDASARPLSIRVLRSAALSKYPAPIQR
jgi:hypothetical protein